MKTNPLLSIGAAMVLLLTGSLHAQEYSVLHHFSGNPGDGDGARPWGSLALDGDTLWGMTRYGGGGSCSDDYGIGCGTVFSLSTDGGGYRVAHPFIGAAPMGDGARPWGSLLCCNGLLYGMTEFGGLMNCGFIFAMNPDGTYAHQLSCYASSPNGDTPLGQFISDGTRLYAMTSAGGEHDLGVIFSCREDLSDRTVLHAFRGGADDGAEPWGALTLGGSRLFGMTRLGGESAYGVIFSIRTDGTDYTVLRSFNGHPEDGARPSANNLTLDGDTLYGMTPYGGMYNAGYAPGYGTIFSLRTDGSHYTLLHHFSRAADDGSGPCGDLLLHEGRLYGLAYRGGTGDMGGIFSIATDGSGFELIRSFAGGPEDGAHPQSSLVTDGVFLYGMVNQGGADDFGIVFSCEIPPAPTPAPTPPIDLTADSAAYGTSGQITVTAEVQRLPTPCYPFVRVAMPDRSVLYYELGRGFTTSPTPYLGFAAGPVTREAPIHGYPALSAVEFSGIETGDYILDGGAVDMTRTTSANNLVYFGEVDSQVLEVR